MLLVVALSSVVYAGFGFLFSFEDMENSAIKRLNRFTTLPILLDMLQRRQLTLLDPALWEDKNDSEIIMEYKKRKGVNGLLAMCFTHDDETVHHWKTFSNGNSGCVVEFDPEMLFETFDKLNLIHGEVVYKKLSEVGRRGNKIDLSAIPFTKRWPYRCEAEYRVIRESDETETFFDIKIPKDSIRKITISQQMPKAIFDTIRTYLRGLVDDPEKRISHSTLYENKRWINSFKRD